MAYPPAPPFRFIPAPAGNAPPAPCRCCSETVHPRACGERPCSPRCGRVDSGSSPRLRGTLQVARSPIIGVRFIPAPAGNASSVRVMNAFIAVHPRACGERNQRVCRRRRYGDGSSPRLRGTPHRAASRLPAGRFIPAPAGNAGQVGLDIDGAHRFIPAPAGNARG